MRSEDRKNKVAVVVGTVTNDLRILNLPKLKVSSKSADSALLICSPNTHYLSLSLDLCSEGDRGSEG